MTSQRGMERYLLDGERVVVALHQHWAKITGPVALAVLGLAVALTVDAKTPQSLGVIADVVWIGWAVLLLWTLWQVLAWRHDWFVATDKRLLLTYGLISTRVAMMPLMKVTDMSYQRSIPGRMLGYGQFIMESAGQEQALRDVRWIPEPDHTYRAICAEMFGVEDRDRVLVREIDGDDLSRDDHDDGLTIHDSRWKVVGRPPAGSDDDLPTASAVEEYGTHSRAIPLQRSGPGAELPGRGDDLGGRQRPGDTGPIPLFPPQADD